jgi:copper(I)-binding protein
VICAARALAAVLLAGVALVSSGCTQAPADPLQVADARIRTVIPGQDVTAAYVTLTNRASTPFVIAAVESADARAIEIHAIERAGDSVRMRRLPELTVEPGATVRLEPGGIHLMVFGVGDPDAPFAATLVGADGVRVEVAFAHIPPGGD